MKRLLFLLLVAAGFISTSKAGAAVFERDWRTPGDGLLTYDDVNQREWLDLPISRLIHFPGSTLEERYQSVIDETAPGGQFEGFMAGERTDVIGLAHSAGIDTTTDDVAINQLPTNGLIDLLGGSDYPGGSAFAVGFIDEEFQFNPPRNFCPCRVGAIFGVNPRSGPGGMAGLSLTFGSDFLEGPGMGVMLYRQVPEGNSFSLALIAILSFKILGDYRSRAH